MVPACAGAVGVADLLDGGVGSQPEDVVVGADDGSVRPVTGIESV